MRRNGYSSGLAHDPVRVDTRWLDARLICRRRTATRAVDGRNASPAPGARFGALLQPFLSLLSLILFASAALADVTIDVELDPAVIEAGDQTVLQVTVEGAANLDQPPSVPQVAGLRIQRAGQSSQVSIVNGKMTRSVVYQFAVQASDPGKFSIGPVIVQEGGKTYHSRALNLEVVRAAAPSTQRPNAPPADDGAEASDAIFVRAFVDDADVYVGEQVTLRFQFYQQVGFPVLDTRLEAVPETPGFLKQELPPQRTSRTTLGGKAFQVTELVYALFPTQAGDLELGPGTVTCTYREVSRRRRDPFRDPFGMFGGFDDRQARLTSQPVKVRVRALPTPAPSDFTGGVGTYRLRASLDRTQVTQGEPITLSMTIAGTGNVSGVAAPPIPDLPGFREFAPSAPSVETTREDEDRVGGKSELSIVLVPETTGRLLVPPLTISVFRPGMGKYESVRSESLWVDVSPGSGVEPSLATASGNPSRVGWDLRTIRTETKLEPIGTERIWRRASFWVVQGLPLVLLAGAFVVQRRRRETSRNLGAILQRKAPSQLRKELQVLTTLGPAETADGFRRLEQALAQFVQRRFGFPLLGRPREELRVHLETRRIPKDAIDALFAVLERCDFARYAPSAVGPEELKSAAQAAESALNQLESSVTSSRKLGVSTVLLVLVGSSSLGLVTGLVPSVAMAASPPAELDQRFQAGCQAFQNQEYRRAIDEFRAIADAGYCSPELYLNLGNAYFRAGDVGRAIHAFESGRRLSPGDPDLDSNLELARRNLDEESPDNSRVLQALTSMQEKMPLPSALRGLSVLWWAAALWIVARMLVRQSGRWFPGLGIAIGAAVFLCASWVGVQALQMAQRPDGVAVAKELALRSNPDPAATVEFTLPAGTTVWFGRETGGYREVVFSDQIRGWAEADQVLAFGH